MTKIQVNAQGKAYVTAQGKLLEAKAGGDVVTATNTTGYAIASGDKVYIQHTYDGWNILALTTWIRNFATNGTVTIDDTTGVASVSSTSRYVYFDLAIDYTKPWEFKTKVDYTAYEYNSFLICGKASNANMLTQSGFSLFICGNNSVNGEGVNTLQMIYDQNGTATQIGTAKNSIAENSTNYLKCGWDGQKFYVSCSTDGETWTTKTQASTTPTAYSDLRHCLLGTSWTAQSYLHGSMYLKETYIYSNGAYLFSPYLMNLAPDYYIGFANENIGVSGMGEVKTVLPEE